jgi:hypothetical protein
MSKHRRQSTIDAMNRFYQRQLNEGKPKESRAHYGKPEKEVEKACLDWMRSRGWSVQIFEAKATWSPEAGRFIQQSMRAGTCDCLGNTDEGIGCAVEFKAPGALSTFNSEKRHLQREFIIQKIKTNCFACVVDSVERLELIYTEWLKIKSEDREKSREYLISMLPQKSLKTRLKDERLFDE